MTQDEIYMKVRTYIKSHPDATIIEICENTNIPLRKIISFIKDGDFILQDKEDTNLILIRCENCGVKLLSGRYCKNCKKKMDSISKKKASGKFFTR